MMISFSLNTRKCYGRSVSVSLLAMSLFLAAIFIASCGDEGDVTEESMTAVVQPEPTPTDTQTPALPEMPAVEPPPVVEEEEEQGISFSADIQPILNDRCATPGCHAAPVAAGLDLTGYDTFEKAGAFTAGNGKGSLVVIRIDGGGMPPGGPPLDDDQIQLFIDWIDQGAEDN